MKDPLFLHEYIEKEKASALRQYKNTLKEVNGIVNRSDMYNLAREIMLELGYLDYEPTFWISTYGGAQISIKLNENDTISSAVNACIDIMDNLTQDTNYKLDTDATRVSGSYYAIVYSNGIYAEQIQLDIYIATSTKCVAVPVTKTVTEMVYTCKEEKDSKNE